MEYVVWWLLVNIWWIITGGILLAFAFLAVTLIRNSVRRRARDSAVSDGRSRT